MKKYFTIKKLLRLLAESTMIIFSVLLAFYFENLRQERADRQTLISDLKELAESIKDDTLVMGNIGRYFIRDADTVYRETLNHIRDREPVEGIIVQLWLVDPLNYHNWTVKRMLDGDELKTMETTFRNEIWEYNRFLDDMLNGNVKTINDNNKKVLELIFSRLEYKDEFSQIHALSDTMPLLRYQQYRDSSVVYSDQVKGYIVHNLTALGYFRFQIKWHRERAIPTIKMVEDKIRELE
jgi:hypothetical protein